MARKFGEILAFKVSFSNQTFCKHLLQQEPPQGQPSLLLPQDTQQNLKQIQKCTVHIMQDKWVQLFQLKYVLEPVAPCLSCTVKPLITPSRCNLLTVTS